MPRAAIEWQAGLSYLASQGLNLVASFSVSGLPRQLQDQLTAQIPDSSRFASLILTANAGRDFWEALQSSGPQGRDPVDHFSLTVSQTLVERNLDGAEHQVLYPGPFSISLSELGQLAGWHHPSPIGNGIHPKYGLWFAYRSLLLVGQDLPHQAVPRQASPCDSCVDKPCMSACPGQAVHFGHPLALNACIKHRISDHSSCRDRCLSRLACPVGAAYRYDEDQLQYHYLHSLESLELWLDPE
jgi:NAD-dependent dihydropyrimidine dehydrogenase PreA subunit